MQDDSPVTSWHSLPVAEALRLLDTSPRRGLRSSDARERLQEHGPNIIHETKRRSVARMFLGQFADFMILVLIGAAVISGLIGDPVDTAVILAIVALNAVIGFAQEYRAERAIAALKRLAALNASVIRDGQPVIVPAAALVPGDIVLLEAGNAVPADVRLIEVSHLRTDESSLTGESQPVDKLNEALSGADMPLGDRRNMAYKGTIVTYGRARGLVTATGANTELGRIAKLLGSAPDLKTPLQLRLTRFGQVLSLGVLAICVVVFAAGLLRGEPVLLMALTAISLAVAAIPEALPAVVTMSLALGARELAARHALIRKLPAVETLGSVTFICSDKTGTLTQNRMHVEVVCADGSPVSEFDRELFEREPWQTLITALALSNDADPGANDTVCGDPTEVALYRFAEHTGVSKPALATRYPRIAEVPFDSERSRMTTLHRDGSGAVAFVKGAPEQVLPLCRAALSAGGETAFDPAVVGAAMDRMTSDGLRVLAFAFCRFDHVPAGAEPEIIERDLTYLGLVGLLDPPRPEAREAVRQCRDAGITPVMITGDHPATARNIAQRLNVISGDSPVLTGQELAALTDDDFARRVENVRVYARVAPEQKIRIVDALQRNGEFVAMTGDGVNDAPALRRADIGVAMGLSGTDVAKESGHMILLDDNFATIVTAVREGRRIFDNIRKFIKYTMTSNSGEIWTIFLAPFLGLPIPLLPIHILWINLVTDGLPGLALTAEKEEPGVMRRPPRPPGESIFAHGMWQHILFIGLLMGAVSLLTQAWALHYNNAHWQTMVFTVLTLSQLGHVLAVRSETRSLFSAGIFSNLPLVGAVGLTFILQLATIYVPSLNTLFSTDPLTAYELAACILIASVVFFAVETEKFFIRRGWLYANAARRSEKLQAGLR